MVRISCAVALALAALPALAQSKFNPDISLILQGTAAGSSQDPDKYQITGFAPSGGEVAPAPRGFSLGETELILGANVDAYFRGQLTAALTPDNEVEVEEAFFQTLGLGHGFSIKGGRFLSGIGYLNEIHQHAWDFQDAPLVYKAFLGGRFNDDGVQVRWVAPTETFVEVGAEAGRGASFPGSEVSKSGAAAGSVFGHFGGDFGPSTAWRAGLSYLQVEAQDRAFDEVDSLGTVVTQAFSGKSRLWIADFVLKWAPDGNATSTSFKLQGEYFRRREDGELSVGALSGAYSSNQSGWYLQGVWQFLPRWRTAYRYDRLDHGTVSNAIVDSGAASAADFPLLMTAYNPTRQTVMVDFSPSEFSRFRLQLAADKSQPGMTDNQVLLQYILSLGAHGAHKF